MRRCDAQLLRTWHRAPSRAGGHQLGLQARLQARQGCAAAGEQQRRCCERRASVARRTPQRNHDGLREARLV
jgi:hypothetical protein